MKKTGTKKRKTKISSLSFSQIERNLLFRVMYGKGPNTDVFLIDPTTQKSHHVFELTDHVISTGAITSKNGDFKITAIENEHVITIEDPTGKLLKSFSNKINHPLILKIETNVHPESNGEHYVKLLEVREPLKELTGGAVGVELLVKRLKDNFEVMKTYNEVNRLLLQ